MRRLLSVLCWAAAALALAANAENWCLRFAEDNVFIGHVNVKGVRAIPQIGALIDGQDRLSRMADGARKQMAVDLETVTDVWFGVSPTAGPIAVLRGDYNLAAIRGAVSAMADLRISTPPGVEFVVAEARPNKGQMVAFLSPKEAVVGQAVQVEAFLSNQASGNQHTRHEDLTVLEAPPPLVACVMLGVPKEMGKLPPVIADQIALLTLTVAEKDGAEMVLTVQPHNPEMAAPLAAWCQSSLELLHLLPPEQFASLSPLQAALFKGAQAAAVPQGVALSASLPLEIVQKFLARRLGAGGPGQPQL